MTEEEKKEAARQRSRAHYAANKEAKKAYQKANKKKISADKKIYFQENREEFNKRAKKYRKNNRNKINEKTKKRSTTDEFKKKRNNDCRQKRVINPLFRLTGDIRCIIGKSLRRQGYKKTSKTQTILGCSFEEFKSYLESKFEIWMNWENRGKYNGNLNYGWDIDHIIPLDTATTEDEIIKLNHYTNLQPLCSKYNRDIKKNK